MYALVSVQAVKKVKYLCGMVSLGQCGPTRGIYSSPMSAASAYVGFPKNFNVVNDGRLAPTGRATQLL